MEDYMADVFISYSRKDIAFARLLYQALDESALETWVDWQDIPASTEWLAEVFEAIEQADTFIFIISKTSIESEICKLEISHAIKNKKRLIPIVIDEIDPRRVTPELASINWLLILEENQFSRAFQDLITAIQTDYKWVKKHTRLQVRALEWERKDSDSGYLLRGQDLVEAEQWLAQAEDKEPQPTTLHEHYITVSKKASIRRKRKNIGLAAVLAVIIIMAAISVIYLQERAMSLEKKMQLSSELIQAVRIEDTEAARKALADGAEVNMADIDGMTSLLWAVGIGHPELVLILIEAGADVNLRYEEVGDTPLHEAAVQGNTEVARLLIEAGAGINVRNDYDLTPLQLSVYHGHVDLTSLLVEAGADVTLQASQNLTLLHWAAYYGHTDVASILVKAGADVNARDIENETPLHGAVINGHTDSVLLLLDAGAEVDAQNEHGWTPLLIAAAENYIDTALILLEAGADVHARNDQNLSALLIAMIEGHTELAAILRQFGAVE
jgi:ankyrin repeat protein